MARSEKKYPTWKRFDMDAAAERTPALPSLQSLAYDLAALIGPERQKEFSASLDWGRSTPALVAAYQDKIAAERQQLETDNEPCAYIDAWNDTPATEADNLADPYGDLPTPTTPCTLAADLRSSLLP
jgi:hypothetical protein